MNDPKKKSIDPSKPAAPLASKPMGSPKPTPTSAKPSDPKAKPQPPKR